MNGFIKIEAVGVGSMAGIMCECSISGASLVERAAMLAAAYQALGFSTEEMHQLIPMLESLQKAAKEAETKEQTTVKVDLNGLLEQIRESGDKAGGGIGFDYKQMGLREA